MEHDRADGEKSADQLSSLAAEQLRNGVPPTEVEVMLVERGLSQQMAALVVQTVLRRGLGTTRGFVNLHLDLWRVVRSNPLLFIVLPALVWFPFNFLAESVALARGGGTLAELATYYRVSHVTDLFAGAWLAAVLFKGIRGIAAGTPVGVPRAVWGGTRQYGRYLKTTWSFSWRVGLASLALVVPGILFSMWFALAIPVTAFEGISGVHAVKASRELMRGKLWRLTWYFLGFLLVYLPWGFGIASLMPVTETPVLSALGTIPFNMVITLWWIWLGLMYVDVTGNPGLAPPVAATEARLAGSGEPRGGARRGRKRLAVTIAGGLALVALGFFAGPDPPPFEGERIVFGNDQQHSIYYDDDVTQQDVWLAGEALVNLGWFDDEEPMAVRLGSDGSVFWLYLYVLEDVPSNDTLMESLRWTESYLSQVMGKTTRIVMLHSSLTGIEEIPVSREVRPPESWVYDHDSDLVHPASPTTAVAKSVLESAVTNQEITRWVDQWTEVCGKLFPWSFEMLDVQVRSFDPEKGREMTLLAQGDALKLLRATLEWSPSGDFALNMFVHNMIRRGAAWSLKRQEPEQWLYLFGAADGKGWPVMAVGPSTLLHAIGWIDERTAVVLGIAPVDSVDCLYIWRVTVDDKTARVEGHKGPVVTASQHESLSQRWQTWVRSHYSEVDWAVE